MQIFSKLLLILVMMLGIVTCRDDNEEAINEITASLIENLDMTELDITNAVELTEVVPAPVFPVIEETAMVEEKMMPLERVEETDLRMVPKDTGAYIVADTTVKSQIIPKTIRTTGRDPNVIQQDTYIKIGGDVSGIVVKRNRAEKITTAVFPRDNTASVDIYLYAIPTYSKLVRNDNTLIGFVKNLEPVYGQAQFTRYWNGKRSNGTYVRRGNYNIYVEYYYKNSNGQILSQDGRFWGGNHREWTLRIL